MLVLKDIVKHYKAGDSVVEALKGVSLNFRKNEFVSILGQSGCGKTTLLNIIGGLDRYTSGDLVISGKSTKKFTEPDWDSYRNHSIGFVFQSYNLIPHQSVLANVELALTLSGVGKAERRRRAKEALDMVGLGDQLNKRPNQMSGGQMQRVAIARALVNDPEILLADEPTGALDSETSVQIMNILKEISKDKLIIMVTHNPELAEEYSSRIIRLLDGKVISDSAPYSDAEAAADHPPVADPDRKEKRASRKERKKRSMSYLTALSLSLNNLMTKKARTFLTSFAGSIGIIGIALILALSNGTKAYIDATEQETLANYPVMIDSQSMDLMSMMMNAGASMNGENVEPAPEGYAATQGFLFDQIHNVNVSTKTNDLKSFRKYLEKHSDEVSEFATDIRYRYDTTMYVYNDKDLNNILKVNPNTLSADCGVGEFFATKLDDTASQFAMATDMDLFTEIFTNDSLRESTYELLEGKMPEKYDEVVLLLDQHGRITDYSLYTMGILDRDDLIKSMKDNDPDAEPNFKNYKYSDFVGMSFRVLAATDLYEKGERGYVDRTEDADYLRTVLEDALQIKIVGVAKYTEAASSVEMVMGGMLGYLPELSQRIMTRNNDSDIVAEQKANPDVDVFTGFEFKTAEDIEAEIDAFDLSTIPPMYQPLFAGLEGESLRSAIRSYIKLTTPSTTYEDNLATLGAGDMSEPTGISIYCKDFESKDRLVEFIDNYNASVPDEKDINYTDYIGLMMSSITTIINAITYILAAFVAISLVVSSIMIGIITYISVLERTKEIGVLRSIGASKNDIARVFNAETIIVGFTAGVIGIIATVLLCIPVNAIIHAISGVSEIGAELPAAAGLVLIVISVLLTVFAGLFPSRVAAKKDPVEALRTE